ncbi:class I SAM-dependent methyltransferase [Virgibacillus senegalensis]|uniref:class I SAM-dependent methyltransferase n=1 Tax=Virgibacillus senegalensis TaxID=1499679 RepID=UPI00069E969F|nr:class I SAM-dependent methyltransferase [Virgibacillus senegalensis]
MGKWFPAVYDFCMKPLERRQFKKVRTELISKAKGRVLEIGAGSGINFPYYLHQTQQVDAVEPDQQMLRRSASAREKSGVPIKLHEAKAEKLPFADNTFDTVVATLVFCSVSDPWMALAELERVSKPGAQLLFFEHVRIHEHPFWAKVQDILTPVWKKVCDGCHLNRETLHYVKNTDLSIKETKAYYKGIFVTMECLNTKQHEV